jgi:hypothetical protein
LKRKETLHFWLFPFEQVSRIKRPPYIYYCILTRNFAYWIIQVFNNALILSKKNIVLLLQIIIVMEI